MRTLVFIILSYLPANSFAQLLTVGFADRLPQASAVNPAIEPDCHQVIVSLPSVAFNYDNSAFAFRDLVRRYSHDSVVYDMSNVLSKLDRENNIRYQLNASVLRMAWTKEHWFFSVMAADRMNAEFSYRKDLVDFFWNGNAHRLGDTLSIAPGLNATWYREYGIGVGYSFPKLSIGIRAKALFGIANALTKKNELKIFTDETDFSTTFSSDYFIVTSGIKNIRKDCLRASMNLLNPGYAFDIGAIAEILPDVYMGVSLNDMGKIKWKDDVMTLRNQGLYTYRGIQVGEDLKLDSAAMKNMSDTLLSCFEPILDSPSYWSRLTPNSYITLRWKINKKTTAGALAFTDYGAKPSFSFFASRQLFPFLEFGGSVSRKNGAWRNIGCLMIARYRKFQVYFLSDNLAGLVNARKSKNINFQTGANIFLAKKAGNRSMERAY